MTSSTEQEQQVEVPDLLELTYAERQTLPAINHRPVFDGLGTPHSWICAACWDDGWTEGWPCASLMDTGREGSVALAKALGLDYSA